MADITSAYRELFRNPKDTLRRHPFVVVGGRHGAGRYAAGEHARTGFTTGLSGLVGKTKQRTGYDFSWVANAIGGFSTVRGELHAYYFPMHRDVDPFVPDGNTNYLDVPRIALLATPKIVWTGQLTACHIGVWRQAPGGSTRFCHIQPMTEEQGRHALLTSYPAIHRHIDNVTMRAIAPLRADCSITVRPKLADPSKGTPEHPALRATEDQVYFIGLYIEKWRFFVMHAKKVDGHPQISSVEELKDGVHEY